MKAAARTNIHHGGRDKGAPSAVEPTGGNIRANSITEVRERPCRDAPASVSRAAVATACGAGDRIACAFVYRRPLEREPIWSVRPRHEKHVFADPPRRSHR